MKSKFILASSLLLAFTANAQSVVTTGGSKYAVIEESTGMWCGYCPDGAVILENILVAQPKAIGVSIHDNNDATQGNQNSNDMMEIAAGYTYTHTTGYCNGYPNGSVDRVVGTNSKVGQSRSLWSSMTSTALATSPKFDITMTHSYKASTHTLTVTVTAKALAAITGSYNTNVYVTEDSIASTGSGYAQHSYFFTTTGHKYYLKGVPNSDSSVAVLASPDYYHHNVLRAMLGGTWGDTGVIATNAPLNGTYTKVYTYVIPTTFNLGHLKLVGIVQKNNATDVNDRPFANGIQAKLTPVPYAVANVSNFNGLEIYPNPATNTINVKAMLETPADVNITISNTVGQTVFTQEYKAAGSMFGESISLDNLSNGLYFVTLTSEGSKVTTKVLVSK